MISGAFAVASLLEHVNSSEHVNVVYNVACLAEEVPCTKDKYDRLWKKLSPSKALPPDGVILTLD